MGKPCPFGNVVGRGRPLVTDVGDGTPTDLVVVARCGLLDSWAWGSWIPEGLFEGTMTDVPCIGDALSLDTLLVDLLSFVVFGFLSVLAVLEPSALPTEGVTEVEVDGIAAPFSTSDFGFVGLFLSFLTLILGAGSSSGSALMGAAAKVF